MWPGSCYLQAQLFMCLCVMWRFKWCVDFVFEQARNLRPPLSRSHRY